MKAFLHLRMLALIAVGTLPVCPRAGAQGQGFGLSVTPSANSVFVNNPLTYSISVTNLTGLVLVDAVVTNVLPASATFQSATNSQGIILTNNSTVVFDLSTFYVGQVALLSVTVVPTAVGFITNTVIVVSAYATNTASSNVVIQVTNAVAQADLGVAITGPVQAVITNDWMTYGVTATNSGPGAAANFVLTNALPPGVLLKGVSPPNYSVAGSNLIFNLGTLTNGAYTNLQFTIQPTNAGVLTLLASIGAPGVLDTNLANNSASTNINVIGYLPGQLEAVTNSSQNPDVVSGLTEQSIVLSNVGTNDVPAARVVVTGLANRLFNAVGTNNGNPFVYYSAPLAAGQSNNLLLQFYPSTLFPFTNGQLQAFAVPTPIWTPPLATTTSTNLNISRIVKLNNGWMLVEWPAITNRTYTVVYSDNVLFSNAMMAPPSIAAPANWIQWLDYGPPTTVSAPTNASSRFYRVLLNQ
ncbi:MAG TPA: DUF11 domain-containing protein [Verrucomicrobiae bacterium]|nr:DUF11 domain-containing protein [Verrucomicrobiae bacterium]